MKKDLCSGRLLLLVALVLFCVMLVNSQTHDSHDVDSEGNWVNLVEAERFVVPALVEQPAHPRFTQWDGETFWAVVRIHDGWLVGGVEVPYLEHIFCSKERARRVLATMQRRESDLMPSWGQDLDLRQVDVANVTTDFAFGICVEGVKGSVDRIVCDNWP